jgi:Cu(I)/Ag(I) efflux system membrane protein CusA/SilA
VLKPREQWPRRLSQQELSAKFDAVMKFPGVVNAWTMPVRGRIDMLATGMRSPLGLKVAGPDVQRIQELGNQVEQLLRDVRSTRTVFAERINDGRYIDIEWDRGELARAGISMEEAQTAVENAIGGDNVTTVIQGRARSPVNVRLPPDSRHVRGFQVKIPNGQLPTVRQHTSPAQGHAGLSVAAPVFQTRSTPGRATCPVVSHPGR